MSWLSGLFSGYKAKAAGVGLMLVGLGGVIGGLVGDGGVDMAAVKASAVVFLNGLGVFGIRVAME